MPLTPEEFETFRRHTGRTVYAPPEGGYKEACCIVGRQAGKSRVAGLVVGYEAITASQEPDHTELYALAIAQDQRAASRVVFRYSVAPFENVKILADQVQG